MQKIFEDKGYDSRLVEFIPSRSRYYLHRMIDLGIVDALKNANNKLKFRWFLRNNPELHASYKKRIAHFDEFMSSIPKTKLYSERELSIEDPFDAYVCGSDQVWNPAWWNDILLLNFTKKPKFAYAASIARESLTKKEEDYLRNSLKEYVGISTREMAAQKMLQGVLNKEVQWCLDPTILVNVEYWESIVELSKISEKYLLVYNLGHSSALVDTICEVVEEKGYKIVFIGFGHNTYFMTKKQKESQVVIDAGPKEWLGLIRGAECILTDSFHGTVFSILFRKKVWCIEKDIEKKNNENTRLYSLLDSLNLRDRFLRNCEDFDIDKLIDYTTVEKRLRELKHQSFEYIDECLNLISYDVNKDTK